MVSGVIFGVVYLILATKTDARENGVFRVYVWLFWGSDGAAQWLGMIDMPIPDRFEIG